jgi:hypothetical protein
MRVYEPERCLTSFGMVAVSIVVEVRCSGCCENNQGWVCAVPSPAKALVNLHTSSPDFDHPRSTVPPKLEYFILTSISSAGKIHISLNILS